MGFTATAGPYRGRGIAAGPAPLAGAAARHRLVDMNTSRRVAFAVSLCCAFGLGLAVGCEKKESRSPGDDADDSNLCTEYKTCNDCIAGQQKKGSTEGEAETQCGAAVIGCWTTWDKPVHCGGKTYDEKP
jgi:hypothetical protein